tara:strand:- start:917 stop:1171 length:255 start_codon:yes stop_codon:yes gene_type:complete
MENYLEEIKIKLKKNIKLEEIDVVDNSHLHSKHKFFDKNKKHLKIIIKSSFLKNLNKIESHKKIMEILKDDLSEKIHALEIKIS